MLNRVKVAFWFSNPLIDFFFLVAISVIPHKKSVNKFLLKNKKIINHVYVYSPFTIHFIDRQNVYLSLLNANQLTGFYKMATLAYNELM